MKINVLQPILDYEGKTIEKEDRGKKRVFTARDAISVALNSPSQTSPKPQTAEDKAKVYRITSKIWEKTGPARNSNSCDF